MKNRIKSQLHFLIDPLLVAEERTSLLFRVLQEEKIKYSLDCNDFENSFHVFVFAHKINAKSYLRFKNRIIIIDSPVVTDNSSVEFVNLDSYEEIQTFLQKIFIIENQLLVQSKIRESDKSYDELKIKNIELLGNGIVEFSEDQSNVIESLLDLELLLLGEDNRESWNIHFKAFIKKHPQFQVFTLYTAEEIINEVAVFEENAFVVNLPYDNLFLLLILKNTKIITESIIVESIITMLMRTIQIQDQKLVKSDGEIDFWKKVFSKIPYPMAVISNLGDLLIYNESFAKIGILPKECLRFKDYESFEMFQRYYKIRRIDFSIKLINVSYFVFYTSEGQDGNYTLNKISSNDSRKDSVDELGIISSSIAHELNNPIAGILAALSLLSLGESWTIENLNDLDDMKNGAKRCKELVEIFLGFSKFSPSTRNTSSIKNSLDQAINLLRFRMVESHLRLEIKYNPTLEKFSHSINASIMSMILYLIFNELMTAFSHEKLITQIHLSIIEGEVMEFSNQINIKLSYDFEYEDKLAQSKLIQHLLAFEKFEITFLRQEIRLFYRS